MQMQIIHQDLLDGNKGQFYFVSKIKRAKAPPFFSKGGGFASAKTEG